MREHTCYSDDAMVVFCMVFASAKAIILGDGSISASARGLKGTGTVVGIIS